MRTLRLYINNQLDQAVNWTLVEDNQIIDSGASLLNEFSGFDNVQVEVYLSASCCSIFKTDKISGISSKRLTDELILGLLEDDLADDIEELKPIMMRIEDNLVYIAIFNREFYEQLLLQLVNLDKPIKLLQSYVYSTTIDEDKKEWVLYLSPEQNFLRTSNFEYYLLDDKTPLPGLFEEMLQSDNKPNSVIIYSEHNHDLEEYQKRFNINFAYAETSLEFSNQVWNFYNQKSSSFKIKLDPSSKISLVQLIKTVRFFTIMMLIFWLINIINIYTNKSKIETELKTNMAKVAKIDKIDPATLDKISNKISDMTHDRGLFVEDDFVPMFKRFLKVSPSTDTNDITGLDYDYRNSTLTIFLRNFDTDQFQNYRDIFKSQHIIADISDYKEYTKNKKKANKTDNNLGNKPEDSPLSNDTKWVITLHSAWLYQTL